MTAGIQQNAQTLYDQDYYLWLQATIEQLRRRQFDNVELDNLVEELESMGRSEKQALESLLTRLWEHLLKLTYWESERDYNRRGWECEIVNFRLQIARKIEDSPSLKPYSEIILARAYQNGRKLAIKATGLNPKIFPVEPIASLEQVLDEDWFPLP